MRYDDFLIHFTSKRANLEVLGHRTIVLFVPNGNFKINQNIVINCEIIRKVILKYFKISNDYSTLSSKLITMPLSKCSLIFHCNDYIKEANLCSQKFYISIAIQL